MVNTRPMEIAERLNQCGVPPKFGLKFSRLLIAVMRKLADGKPVTTELPQLTMVASVSRPTCHEKVGLHLSRF